MENLLLLYVPHSAFCITACTCQIIALYPCLRIVASATITSLFFSIPTSVVKESLIINFVMKQLSFHYKLATWENYKGRNKNHNYKLKLQSKQQTFTTCRTAQLHICKMNARKLCIPTNFSVATATAAINIEFVLVTSARL